MRCTHTYVELAISRVAFGEIKDKLAAAGYRHAFMEDGAVIDMSGIAVKIDESVPEGIDTLVDSNGNVHGKPLPDTRGIRKAVAMVPPRHAMSNLFGAIPAWWLKAVR